MRRLIMYLFVKYNKMRLVCLPAHSGSAWRNLLLNSLVLSLLNNQKGKIKYTMTLSAHMTAPCHLQRLICILMTYFILFIAD